MFLGKCSKWNLNFQNWSKGLCLGVFEPTKQLLARSTSYALRKRQGKQAFVNKNEKKISVQKKSKFIKSLRYMVELFFSTNDFHYLKVARFI